MTTWENNEEIKLFREYLRIPSVHPDVDYDECVEFLKRQAADLELPVKVYLPVPKKPIVVITWVGTQSELPSVVLNSHMDVVPVFPEKWTHPPFGAEMDAEGKIFARGSQDMKCVGMQYLAAIRALKKSGVKALKRTIHVMYVPDEETGGLLGVKEFIKTPEYKQLNVGFALDEGVAWNHETFEVFYAERSIWQINFKISGPAGHGSMLLENTVGQKLHYIVNKMMTFRQQEVKRMKNEKLYLGDVTTVNLTLIKGGKQSNVIPPLMEVTFDVRLAITVNHEDFEKQILRWCEEAGGGIELEYIMKDPKVEPTKIDASNPYWVAFKQTMDDLNLKIATHVFLGATDSRYFRSVGVPAIGFSPMNNTPTLLHDHDEYLKADTYLKGIDIYTKIIPAVANV